MGIWEVGQSRVLATLQVPNVKIGWLSPGLVAGQDAIGVVVQYGDHRLVAVGSGSPEPLRLPGLEVETVQEGPVPLIGRSGPGQENPITILAYEAVPVVVQHREWSSRIAVAIFGVPLPEQFFGIGVVHGHPPEPAGPSRLIELRQKAGPTLRYRKACVAELCVEHFSRTRRQLESHESVAILDVSIRIAPVQRFEVGERVIPASHPSDVPRSDRDASDDGGLL